MIDEREVCMDIMKERISRYRLKLRKKLNPIFGRFRKMSLNNTDFTIISNNCWGG